MAVCTAGLVGWKAHDQHVSAFSPRVADGHRQLLPGRVVHQDEDTHVGGVAERGANGSTHGLGVQLAVDPRLDNDRAGSGEREPGGGQTRRHHGDLGSHEVGTVGGHLELLSVELRSKALRSKALRSDALRSEMLRSEMLGSAPTTVSSSARRASRAWSSSSST